MKAAKIVWGSDTLSQYLKNLRAMAPKTKMNFNGLKRVGEEEALVTYLERATKK